MHSDRSFSTTDSGTEEADKPSGISSATDGFRLRGPFLSGVPWPSGFANEGTDCLEGGNMLLVDLERLEASLKRVLLGVACLSPFFIYILGELRPELRL